MTRAPDGVTGLHWSNGNGNGGSPQKFRTIYADPPWQFANRTGKMAPEHRRLHRYRTMTIEEICALPVKEIADTPAHLYLWCPNALLPWGLQVIEAWGFSYKTHLVWYKIRKDGGPDRRGVGFYYRNVTELLLLGVRGHLRTFRPARRLPNICLTRKREHSRKPDEFYSIIERCSPKPRLELFARHPRPGWVQWGDEIDWAGYRPKRMVLPYGGSVPALGRPAEPTQGMLAMESVHASMSRRSHARSAIPAAIAGVTRSAP